MSGNKEIPALIFSLVITGTILGGGYWWLSRGAGINIIEKLFPLASATRTENPPSVNSSAAQEIPSRETPTAFVLPTTLKSGTTVRINGSTSMAQINKALKESFEGAFPQTRVTIDAVGSDIGLEMLLKGQIDLAALSRPLSDAEKAQGLVAVPVTRDAIAIVISNENPFRRGLTTEEVIDIFEGRITDWSAVGGTLGTIRVLNRPAISGTRQALAKLLLKGSNFGTTPNITTMERDATTPILQALGSNGISYATYSQVAEQETVRTVAIDGLTPEASNYPLRRTLYYVYKESPSEGVRAFLGFAVATIGQSAIANSEP